jgi:uncharacterized protein
MKERSPLTNGIIFYDIIDRYFHGIQNNRQYKGNSNMSNRLKNETSPYLLQHADNPVDWYAWGEEALQKARQEDKPIFLSIGYAACHWCHVMEHESFEDPQIANLLNEHFVSIKVDREERPDLDGIYMEAVVAMTGHGGWPMSVFLTPEGQPFYGGTYFPPVRAHGLPAFRDILNGISRTWHEDRKELFEAAKKLTRRLHESARWGAGKAEFSADVLDKATQTLIQSYDWTNGGWGGAPKFPSPMVIDFLLAQATRGNEPARKMADHALEVMHRGGLYDLVGGGFHRYAVDDIWRVPHFEKMLYDNAQLALTYLHGYIVIGNPEFRRTAEETLDFMQRELMDPSGGFYSSLDADSEGEEGKFYVWTQSEIEEIVTDPDDLELATAVYHITPEGNFEGSTILQKPANYVALADALNRPVDELMDRLERFHQQLFEARTQRVRPATDDKVLVSWNALALTAFSEAARYLDRSDYLEIAQKNADFLLTALHPGDRLLRSWRNGTVRHNAFLEDYAGLIVALLSLYQTDQNLRWYSQAVLLAEEMKAHFSDETGGFYDTRDDQEDLIVRPKEYQDNPIPSGNALAAKALLLLSAFSGETQIQAAVEGVMAHLQDAFAQHPTAFAYWLQAADFAVGPVYQIALLWPTDQDGYDEFKQVMYRLYRPRSILAASKYPLADDAPPLLKERPLVNDQVTAYVCKGFVCQQPVTSTGQFETQLVYNPE